MSKFEEAYDVKLRGGVGIATNVTLPTFYPKCQMHGSKMTIKALQGKNPDGSMTFTLTKPPQKCDCCKYYLDVFLVDGTI